MPRSYGFNGLKSIATTWLALPELQNPFKKNGEGHSNRHYGIEGYKTGQATGFRIFVRRFGLTLDCGALFGCSLVLSCFRGNPIPKRRRVAAVQRCSAIRKYKILFYSIILAYCHRSG
jgi:hypothetical protein